MGDFDFDYLVWGDDDDDDDRRFDHIAGHHLSRDDIEDLLYDDDPLMWPNTKGHPPNRYRVVGETSGGSCIMVIVEEHGHRCWKVITAFPPTDTLLNAYYGHTRRRRR